MVYNIEYLGKQLPIFISHYAMKMLWEESKKTVDDVLLDNAGFNTGIEVFLYYCLEAGHRKEEKIFNLKDKKEEMQWILDDNFLKFQEIVRENFIRVALDAENQTEEPEDEKKNQE